MAHHVTRDEFVDVLLQKINDYEDMGNDERAESVQAVVDKLVTDDELTPREIEMIGSVARDVGYELRQAPFPSFGSTPENATPDPNVHELDVLLEGYYALNGNIGYRFKEG